MKVICSECKTSAYGTIETLTEKGWMHGHGNINGKRFSRTLCGKCAAPEKMVETVLKAKSCYQ